MMMTTYFFKPNSLTLKFFLNLKWLEFSSVVIYSAIHVVRFIIVMGLAPACSFILYLLRLNLKKYI